MYLIVLNREPTNNIDVKIIVYWCAAAQLLLLIIHWKASKFVLVFTYNLHQYTTLINEMILYTFWKIYQAVY